MRLVRVLTLALGTALLAPLVGAGSASAGSSGGAAAAALPATIRAAAITSSCPAPGGVTVPEAALPVADFVFRGHGWGHGMGMSQWGAEGAARLGCGYRTILSTYYRNSTLTQRSMTAPVQLTLASTATRATLAAENGTVRWVAGTTTVDQPARSTWQVVRRTGGSPSKPGIAVLDDSGRARLWVANGAALSARHVAVSVTVRAYTGSSSRSLRARWDVARFVSSSSGIAVSNMITAGTGTTAVQKYLWGLAEVPVSWPQQALRAQVVAARTYLVGKYRSAEGAYVLSTTTADQVYAGTSREDTDIQNGSPWRSAVTATAGEVLLDGKGRAITAMYSSSMGGYTEDRGYVYGSPGISYLKAVDDSRWEMASGNRPTNRSWAVGVSRQTIAAKFGFTSVSSVSVAPRGSAGRLDGLRISGMRGSVATTITVTGAVVRSRLKLLSPGFVVTAGAIAAPSSQPVTGDFDGDGRTDAGWFKSGVFSLKTATGTTYTLSFGSGLTHPVAVVGDWNGDGRDGVGLFVSGKWYLRDTLTTGPAQHIFTYGAAGDLPVVGRWAGATGDGPGVVNADRWYLRTSFTTGPTQRSFRWTSVTGQPVVGDWDHDGDDDPGVRAGNIWRLGRESATGTGLKPAPATVASLSFGSTGDVALSGDFNADGRDTPVIVRGTWFAWRNDLAGGAAQGSLTYAG